MFKYKSLAVYVFVSTDIILVLKFTPHQQDRGLCRPVPLPLADDVERVKVLQNAHWWKAYIPSKSVVRFLSLSLVCCTFVQMSLSLKCLWVWRFFQIFFSFMANLRKRKFLVLTESVNKNNCFRKLYLTKERLENYWDPNETE